MIRHFSRRRGTGAGSAVGLAAGVRADAVGGAEQIDQVRKDASAHFGPLYLTPTVLLKELGVDSNVFNAAGEPKSDFTFTVAPEGRRLGAGGAPRAVPGHRRHRPGLVRDSTPPSGRSIRSSRAAAKSTSAGSRCSREGDYLNTRQRLNYEVDLRARHVENNVDGRRRACGSRRSSRSKRRAGSTTRASTPTPYFDGVSLQRTLNQQTDRLQPSRPGTAHAAHDARRALRAASRTRSRSRRSATRRASA